MQEDYHNALELIFTYGYECCMFKHNICGDQPEVPDSMPDSSNPLPSDFFANPKFSLVLTTTKAMTIEADKSEAEGKVEELERCSSVGDFAGTFEVPFFFFLKFL